MTIKLYSLAWLFTLRNHNEAAVVKTNCCLTIFPKQSIVTHPCITVLAPLVLYLLSDQCKQQRRAPKLSWLFLDRGCYMLSWCIVFFFWSYLLACFPLDFFFVPVFVLCVFFDWCCDNYKKACAAGAPVYSDVSHWAIVPFIGWLKKTNTHLGVTLYVRLCWINGTTVRVHNTDANLLLRQSFNIHLDE